MIAFGVAAGLALAYSGWAALSLGMDRHYADIHGRGKEPDQRTRQQYRLFGALALVSTFAVSVSLEGWAIGAVLCIGLMTASALLLVLLLSYAPQRAIACGKTAAIFAIIFGVIWMIR